MRNDHMTFNKLQKEYIDTIKDIPEPRLKELFHSLFYDIHYNLYIKKDSEAFKKKLTVLETLINETEEWKRHRASVEAVVETPHLIIEELQKEHRKMEITLLSAYLVGLIIDKEFLENEINYINDCDEGNEKECLEKIKNDLQTISIKTDKILKSNPNKNISKTIINYFEKKDNIPEEEAYLIKMLKKQENMDL